MSENLALFSKSIDRPLAEVLRPKRWEDLAGLDDFDASFLNYLKAGKGKLPSLILWGPPGCGKTTLAKLIGQSFKCNFVELSAVLSGVKEIRQVIDQAKHEILPTLLFVDEVHRFNKGQQDAFLPHIESGLISFIGATTENPSFYLNSALLSRLKVLALKSHSNSSLSQILQRATKELGLSISADCGKFLLEFVAGDARRLINILEGFAQTSSNQTASLSEMQSFLKDSQSSFYDRDGEEHYNVASAFIKSLRGSNPDAALFWGFKMLDAGEDPRFLCRRMMIFASEDIGNADPRALQIAVATADAFERLGLPEGKIPIAHCITFLACAPKSNRAYLAMKQVEAILKLHPKTAVPLHLRNAPTGLMQGLGYGSEYQYPHDSSEGFVAGVEYLPDELRGEIFYQPSEHGLEKNIAERLKQLRGAK